MKTAIRWGIALAALCCTVVAMAQYTLPVQGAQPVAGSILYYSITADNLLGGAGVVADNGQKALMEFQYAYASDGTPTATAYRITTFSPPPTVVGDWIPMPVTANAAAGPNSVWCSVQPGVQISPPTYLGTPYCNTDPQQTYLINCQHDHGGVYQYFGPFMTYPGCITGSCSGGQQYTFFQGYCAAAPNIQWIGRFNSGEITEPCGYLGVVSWATCFGPGTDDGYGEPQAYSGFLFNQCSDGSWVVDPEPCPTAPPDTNNCAAHDAQIGLCRKYSVAAGAACSALLGIVKSPAGIAACIALFAGLDAVCEAKAPACTTQ
jgi:hypothetical protein